MIDILALYLLLGVAVACYVYQRMCELGLTGDDILQLLKPETRNICIEHPNLYRAAVILTLFVIVLAWPFFAYKITKNNNGDNNKTFNFQL